MKSFTRPSVGLMLTAGVVSVFLANSAMNAQFLVDSTVPALRLIPTPQSVVMGRSRFAITRDVKIVVENSRDQDNQFAGSQIADEINTELKLKVAAV